MINDHNATKNWRLGPYADPGWFDISDVAKPATEFVMLTVFKLDWTDVDPQKDGIFNRLHSMTIGSRAKKTKIHIESLAQILHGDLHITSRFCDHVEINHRNTQPLAGEPCRYMNRWMTLCYTGRFAQDTLTTCSVLYDCDSKQKLQCNQYTHGCAENQVEFKWDTQDRLVCDEEQQHLPCDHVSVGGSTMSDSRAFVLKQIWGCLGHTFDPTTLANEETMLQGSWPEIIGGCRAWYCCDLSKRCELHRDYALCGGRYQQNQNLGLHLPPPYITADSFLQA